MIDAGRLNATRLAAALGVTAALFLNWIVVSIDLGFKSFRSVDGWNNWWLTPGLVAAALAAWAVTVVAPSAMVVRRVGYVLTALSVCFIVGCEATASAGWAISHARSMSFRSGAGPWVSAMSGVLLVASGTDPLGRILRSFTGSGSSRSVWLESGLLTATIVTAIWATRWRYGEFLRIGRQVTVNLAGTPVIGWVSLIAVWCVWISGVLLILRRRLHAGMCAAVASALFAIVATLVRGARSMNGVAWIERGVNSLTSSIHGVVERLTSVPPDIRREVVHELDHATPRIVASPGGPMMVATIACAVAVIAAWAPLPTDDSSQEDDGMSGWPLPEGAPPGPTRL